MANKKPFRLTQKTTVIQARQHLADNAVKGVICPCCDRPVKINTLTLNATNAICLMVLYHASKKSHDYFHITDLESKSHLMAIKMNGGGDFSRMRHWGLIEEMPKGEGRTSGFWRITERGKEFCENKLSVLKSIVMVNSTLGGLVGDPVKIEDLVGGSDGYKKMMKDTTITKRQKIHA